MQKVCNMMAFPFFFVEMHDKSVLHLYKIYEKTSNRENVSETYCNFNATVV